MTELLEQAIAKLRQMPSDRQNEMAELLFSMIEQDPASIQLSDEQVAEVERRIGEPAEYAEHAEVLAFFRKRAG